MEFGDRRFQSRSYLELWSCHLSFHQHLDSEEAESGALERLDGQLLPQLERLAAAP